ncbi:unnamed protein product [Spirodela intermedia]|uniref:Uncharacterized protein n=1 Tax=Spirodela intermedia TaxID=51605 RepID=A0A7I8IPU1_SPIIN|nr:unnamed protein product [Spirodela intermedia]CAA6659162.1 unnamed protein product [Spirodela intermedia]
MEPADIDWNRLEWRFVKDDLYEHFDAPKWVDFSPSPKSFSPSSVPKDEAWFCRPDCRHPKTAEDFLHLRPSPTGDQRKGLLSSSSSFVPVKVGKTFTSPLGERNFNKNSILRDANLKRRGAPLPPAGESPKSKLPGKTKKSREDLENQDPNLCPATPDRATAKILLKETIKSSAERQEPPSLSLPARNLFPKKEILTQISEFCNEIKKLAMPRRDRNGGHSGEEHQDATNTLGERKIDGKVEEEGMENLRMPPPEPMKEGVKLGLLQEVRSCPPTPQRFASPLASQKKTADTATAAASVKSVPPGILREMVEIDIDDDDDDGGVDNGMTHSPASSGSKTLDLFWFLKPCASYI